MGIYSKILIFVTFSQCLHPFHLLLCCRHVLYQHQPNRLTQIRRHIKLAGSKSSSNIQSCQTCSGSLFGYGKVCHLKEMNEYDLMNKLCSAVCRDFNVYLTSIYLLKHKQNHDRSEALRRLSVLECGITSLASIYILGLAHSVDLHIIYYILHFTIIRSTATLAQKRY